MILSLTEKYHELWIKRFYVQKCEFYRRAIAMLWSMHYHPYWLCALSSFEKTLLICILSSFHSCNVSVMPTAMPDDQLLLPPPPVARCSTCVSWQPCWTKPCRSKAKRHWSGDGQFCRSNCFIGTKGQSSFFTLLWYVARSRNAKNMYGEFKHREI